MRLSERVKILLKKELVAPEGPASPQVREEIRVDSNKGRDHRWPLRLLGASPSTITRMVRDLNSGEMDLFLSIAHELEESDTHYNAVMGSRKLAAAQLPWALDTDHMLDEQGMMSDESTKVIAAVQGLIDAHWWKPLLVDMLDGLGKGFSVCEIMWERTPDMWTVNCCKWRDPRHFAFDEKTGESLLIKHAPEDRRDGAEPGRPMPEAKFLTHFPRLLSGKPTRGALARPIIVLHLLRTLAIIDWAALLEIFGQPFRVGYYPVGATDDYKEELKDALYSMGSDAAAIIAEGSKVDFVEAGVGAAGTPGAIYNGFLSWCDEQVSKCVLGVTMTTDSGSSRAQAEVHADVQQARRNYDAQMLAATVMTQLIGPFVRFNFGSEALVPQLRPETDDPDDLQVLASALSLMIDRGMRVSESWIMDKFGAPDIKGDDRFLVPVAEAFKPDDPEVEDEGDGLPGAKDPEVEDQDETPVPSSSE